MPRATFYQTSFNAGEWSPLTYGRIDLPKRKAAMSSTLNYIPLLQGPQTRRPGTAYVAAAADANVVRLQPFQFNVFQAYVLEFTANKIRFYTNGGQLLSGGTPYQVNTPYAAADLANLYFTQSADVLYICHPNYPPATLSRLGATNWVLANLSMQDGPYLPVNITSTKMSCSSSVPGTTGATLTATSTTGINNGAGFQASDVGRMVRLNNVASAAATQWVWMLITGVTSSTVATVTVMGLTP
ncbi:hypothetical protein ACN9MB_09115 [Dyella kyungheensis]|uniref:hypothetical protein n=1 Tax=Dyella kyungheensis TaxID=1242174 RepID=UPI003CF8F37F